MEHSLQTVAPFSGYEKDMISNKTIDESVGNSLEESKLTATTNTSNTTKNQLYSLRFRNNSDSKKVFKLFMKTQEER